MLKICILGNYHHKNIKFLNYLLNNSEILSRVNNIEEADIIMPGSRYVDTKKYKNKRFIFGPHFSVFPNKTVNALSNVFNNSIYIQPSDWVKRLWVKDLKYTRLNIKAINFGVNTEKFNEHPDELKKNVMVYFKRRNKDELDFVENFLRKNNIEYKVFSYTNRYKEDDYINFLKTCKYGIWLGTHESQGFALQEALSCNVPLLVWNVKRMDQEIGSNRNKYKGLYGETIPYWDKSCGEFFYDKNEFENSFKIFIDNLDNYNPRQFVKNVLSNEITLKKWEEFLVNIDNYIMNK